MENDVKDKILVILTGGTICSVENEVGKRFSDAKNVRIIEHFKSGESPYRDLVDFVPSMPLDILSENMTIAAWNKLLDEFRTGVDWNHYKGIIVLHGTDTLAFTSAMLSIALAGVRIPVCMVSSQLPLKDEKTNGHVNFRASVELIMNGIAPNVYAVYRNSDGQIYVHYGAHLLQCANYSEDFFSADAMRIETPDNACLIGCSTDTDVMPIMQFTRLTPCVANISPFVGINYATYDLEDIRAVVHGTYHSETVCVERKNGTGEYSTHSILHLIDRCAMKNIPVFLAPCSPTAFKYESTGDALQSGAFHIEGMTAEMAYVKTLIGCAMDLTGMKLATFVNRSINGECVYKTAENVQTACFVEI